MINKYFNKSMILMLHRVGLLDKNRISANQGMVVNPMHLEKFIFCSKKSGWKFISMDEVEYNIKKSLKMNKVLSITFDDGYIDNYQQASTLLTSYDVPFCIYLTTGYIGSNVIPWWYKLESILADKNEIEIFDGNLFLIDNLIKKNSLFMYIREKLMYQNYHLINKWLDNLYSKVNPIEKKIFMDWSDVNNLLKNKYVTIGAHTHNHYALSTLYKSSAENEILISKKIILEKTGFDPYHFAYPYGGNRDFSLNQIDLLKRAGFSTAVTSNFNHLSGVQIDDIYRLPRVFFSNQFSLNKANLFFLKSTVNNFLFR